MFGKSKKKAHPSTDVDSTSTEQTQVTSTEDQPTDTPKLTKAEIRRNRKDNKNKKKQLRKQRHEKNGKQGKQKRVSLRKVNADRLRQMEQQADKELVKAGIDPKSRAGRAGRKRIVNDHLPKRLDTLSQIAPVGNIIYNSDYFLLDSSYATILTFVATKGHVDDLPPMWALQMVPGLYDKKFRGHVTAKLLTSYSKRNKDWAEKKLTSATDVAESGLIETTKGRHGVERSQYAIRQAQTAEVSQELAMGASYLDMSIRILLKADNAALLDSAVEAVRREYASKLNSSDISLAKFFGEQQTEYAAMLDTAREQLGQNFQLPSVEAAGSYPFMMQPPSDPHGTYVGTLANDVNTGPVIWDTMKFHRLMLVGASDRAVDFEGEHEYSATAGWGVQFAHDALLSGKRVFHIVLNNQNLLGIGQNLTEETTSIPMASGAINMMEAWGKTSDELAAWSVLVNKISLMAQLLAGKVADDDSSAIDAMALGTLSQELEKFYISKEMWYPNPEANRERLSLVGPPHAQVPLLRQLNVYIKSSFTSAHNQGGLSKDGEDEEALHKLSQLFEKIKSQYGHLFDKLTFVDDLKVNKAKQVIFELGQIGIQGNEPLMAQFVNTLTYAEQQMSTEDVLIIHGADHLNTMVEKFLYERMKAMWEKDVKIILMYDSPEEMAKRQTFMEIADVLLTGHMAGSAQDRYLKYRKVDLPPMVMQAMSSNDRSVFVLNRGPEDTAVFNWDAIF